MNANAAMRLLNDAAVFILLMVVLALLYERAERAGDIPALIPALAGRSALLRESWCAQNELEDGSVVLICGRGLPPWSSR